MMAALCEECDEKTAAKYCASCGQKLCLECDTRIHNRGKRALHVRGELNESKKHPSLASEQRKLLSKAELFCQGDLQVTVLQRIGGLGENETPEFKRMLETAMDYYINEAFKGHLMHEQEGFRAAVIQAYQTQFGVQSKFELEELYSRVKDSNHFHVTVRKFGDSKPLVFISLLLTSISQEVIVWILLSIKNDKMKPTDKLILSRIKEYFLLKVNQKDWNSAVEAFFSNPSLLSKCELLPEVNLFDDKEEKESLGRCQLSIKPDFDANKEEKTVSNYRFEIKGDKWEYEDAIDFSEQGNEDWDNFKSYINTFFGEEVTISPSDSRSKLKKQKNNRNIQKWLSSVETALSKPTTSLTSNHSLQKILTEQSISRAIPGGRPAFSRKIWMCTYDKANRS
jgi:hypothetical protein